MDFCKCRNGEVLPKAVPLSSECSDLRAQPLALPNVCKHKIRTGLPSNSALTFPLEVKPPCYLLSVFRPKQQYPFLVCWPVTTCPAFLAIPSITKNHFQGCWMSTRVNFCCPYPALSSQGPGGQRLAVSLFANWKSAFSFPKGSINRNPEAEGWGNPSPSPVGSFPLRPAGPGSGLCPGRDCLERKNCCNLWGWHRAEDQPQVLTLLWSASTSAPSLPYSIIFGVSISNSGTG